MRTEFSENDIFSDYASLLEELDVTKEEASDRMWELCESLVTNYSSSYILRIFKLNLVANTAKYRDLVEFFNEDFYPFSENYRSETYDSTRTPNLQSMSSSTGTGTADTQRKQSQTQTTTPSTTTTTTHEVQPYDVTGLRTETKDTSEDSGSSSTTMSFSGDPDHTSTSTSTSAIISSSGSEETEYNRTWHGRDGRRPTSEVIEDGLKAADLHDVLDIIIQDLSNQIFLQVWR